MNIKHEIPHIFEFLGVIVGGIGTVGLILDIVSIGSLQRPVIALCLGILLLSLYFRHRELINKITALEKTKPVLNVVNFGVETKDFTQGILNKDFIHVNKDVVFIEVSNSPKDPGNAEIAMKVLATIKWFDKGRLIVENNGRWWYPVFENDALLRQTVDIEPNGERKKNQFAIKQQDEENFYAWSLLPDGNHQEFELTGKKYDIVIILSGRNVRKVFKCIIGIREGRLYISPYHAKAKRSNEKKLP